MNHLKSLSFCCVLPSALLFVSQSVETQEDTDFKTNSKVLHRLAQHPQKGKFFKEEQSVHQREGLHMRTGSA